MLQSVLTAGMSSDALFLLCCSLCKIADQPLPRDLSEVKSLFGDVNLQMRLKTAMAEDMSISQCLNLQRDIAHLRSVAASSAPAVAALIQFVTAFTMAAHAYAQQRDHLHANCNNSNSNNNNNNNNLNNSNGNSPLTRSTSNIRSKIMNEAASPRDNSRLSESLSSLRDQLSPEQRKTSDLVSLGALELEKTLQTLQASQSEMSNRIYGEAAVKILQKEHDLRLAQRDETIAMLKKDLAAQNKALLDTSVKLREQEAAVHKLREWHATMQPLVKELLQQKSNVSRSEWLTSAMMEVERSLFDQMNSHHHSHHHHSSCSSPQQQQQLQPALSPQIVHVSDPSQAKALQEALSKITVLESEVLHTRMQKEGAERRAETAEASKHTHSLELEAKLAFANAQLDQQKSLASTLEQKMLMHLHKDPSEDELNRHRVTQLQLQLQDLHRDLASLITNRSLSGPDSDRLYLQFERMNDELRRACANLSAPSSATPSPPSASSDTLNLSIAEMQAEIRRLTAQVAELTRKLLEFMDRKPLESSVDTAKLQLLEMQVKDKDETIDRLHADMMQKFQRMGEMQATEVRLRDMELLLKEMKMEKDAQSRKIAELEAQQMEQLAAASKQTSVTWDAEKAVLKLQDDVGSWLKEETEKATTALLEQVHKEQTASIQLKEASESLRGLFLEMDRLMRMFSEAQAAGNAALSEKLAQQIKEAMEKARLMEGRVAVVQSDVSEHEAEKASLLAEKEELLERLTEDAQAEAARLKEEMQKAASESQREAARLAEAAADSAAKRVRDMNTDQQKQSEVEEDRPKERRNARRGSLRLKAAIKATGMLAKRGNRNDTINAALKGMSPEEIFRKLDEDQSGFLSLEETRTGLAKLTPLTAAQIESLISDLKVEEDGLIDPEEFVSKLVLRQGTTRDREQKLAEHHRGLIRVIRYAIRKLGDPNLKVLFSEHADGNGGLTSSGFRVLVSKTSAGLSNLQLSILFRACDIDDNQEIDFDEFYSLMTAL